MKLFKLEPKWQKCIWQIEYWKKNNLTLERVQWWRFGFVTVQSNSKKEIETLISVRDKNQRVCLSDLFETIDQDLKDCKADDLYCPSEMSDKESERLKKLFEKDSETMFEKEGWNIFETKLYFESDILIEEQISS